VAGGKDFLLGMLDETSATATASGYPPGGPFFERVRGFLTTEGSPMTASMFRDIKAGLPVEADHVIGDLIARADAAKVPVPKLRIAYTHLKAYEKQRVG
jgi:2-dehydropantoate 2-reductase